MSRERETGKGVGRSETEMVGHVERERDRERCWEK